MKPWAQNEISIIHKYYLKLGKDRIKQLLPIRTWRAIRAKATKFGLLLEGKKEPNWTCNELKLLKEARGHLSIRKLQKPLPGRTLHAIWTKSERMGLRSKYYWTEREIRILEKYNPSRNKHKLEKLLPNRKWKNITQKARKLGLQGFDTVAIQRERFKLLNKDPAFNKKRLQALCRKPTKPEKQLIEIIEENKLPYKYVGDGSFIIEGLNPDFVNVNGRKRIIEVFGRVWHETLVKDWHRTELGREMILNSYGYKTLIIWDDELNDKQAIIQKIKAFDKSKS